MPKHLSQEVFTRRFLALVKQLSRADRATLGNGWAGGWHIQSPAAHKRMMEMIQEISSAGAEAHAARVRKMLDNPNYERDFEMGNLLRAGKTAGEIFHAIKGKYPTLRPNTVKVKVARARQYMKRQSEGTR